MSLSRVVLAVLALACVAVVVLLAGRRRRSAAFSAADYRPKALLSAWERHVLREVAADLPEGHHVCPQVHLTDLVAVVPRYPVVRRAALNRVTQKWLDFVVIDRDGVAVLVIELDDRSHDWVNSTASDGIVDAVLRQCRIPVLRVCPGQAVDVRRHLAGIDRLVSV